MNNSPSVLLIDNQTLIRQGMADLIKKQWPKARVLTAASLEIAASILRQHKVELILTEMLGGIEGGINTVGLIHSCAISQDSDVFRVR